MDQRSAMDETIELINARLSEWTLDHKRINSLPQELQQTHLNEMWKAVKSGKNPQDTEADFGEAKLGRWLGWMQAAGTALGVLTLDDCKEINKRWAD
jgi:hypothetical protein